MNARRPEVAPDGTHHRRDGVALYSERYDVVLPFHPPGLAPVRRRNLAWHIDLAGQAAYLERFHQTFGFYEELAAVEGDDGWLHIRTDGSPAYAACHAWCGNFQGGLCSVRQRDGAYLHIDKQGAPAYSARWRYAGDFREGVAVVQGDDGRSSHIGTRGDLVHGQWFDDLDVFHKGVARARDGDGWFHVDRSGRPAYSQRYAMVEPFYNGQARVERGDGTRLIIVAEGSAILLVREGSR